jgi:hypothetical protein
MCKRFNQGRGIHPGYDPNFFSIEIAAIINRHEAIQYPTAKGLTST